MYICKKPGGKPGYFSRDTGVRCKENGKEDKKGPSSTYATHFIYGALWKNLENVGLFSKNSNERLLWALVSLLSSDFS